MGASIIRRALHHLRLEVTRHPAPNTLPWQIQQLIARGDIQEVVDVGAHAGGFVRMLRDVAGYDGPVTSFEPSRSSYEALVLDRAGDGHWSGYNVALGAEPGQLPLNTFEGTDFNSFLSPNNLGRARFATFEAVASELVQVRRLDEFPINDGCLLKIDTQGFDLQVLEGATRILGSVTAVMVELPVRPIYHAAPSMWDIVSRLADWGYEPVGFFPLSRARDRLRVIEFDGVFVRAT